MGPLPGDHPAGDAGPGIAGGIGHIVIRSSVDHQGSSARLEQRILFPLLQGDRLGHRLDLGLAVWAHRDIGEVPA